MRRRRWSIASSVGRENWVAWEKLIYRTVLKIAIVWCALLSSRSLNAQVPSCGTRSPDLAQLCAAISPVGWNFPPPNDLQQAIDTVAKSLTQAPRGSDAARVLAQSIDLVIRQSIAGKPAAYCDALSTKAGGRFEDRVIATACLRPTCLLQVPQELPSYPPDCASIPADSRDTLRKAAVAAGAQALASVSCVPTQASCLRVDGEAVALVALVDQLRPLIRTMIEKVPLELPECGAGKSTTACAANIGASLDRGLRIWAVGSAVSQLIASNSAYATMLDPDKSFARAWTNLQLVADEFKKPGSGRVFPWDYQFLVALIKLEPVMATVTNRATDGIKAANAADLLALWQRGEGLLIVLSQNSSSLSDPTLNAFYDKWSKLIHASLGDNPSSGALAAAEAQIRDQAQVLEAAEKIIRDVKAKLTLGASALSSGSCQPGNTATDWIHGTQDVCFPEQFRALWLAGFRFAFAPCKPGQRPCNTVGDIRMLVPTMEANGTRSWVALPTGISAIKAQVTENAVTILGLPPERALSAPKQAVLTALQRMIPLPLHVVDYGSMEVSDGPVVEFKNVRLALGSGITTIDLVNITVSRAGLAVKSDLQSSAKTFEAAILDSLSAALKKEVQIPGITVTDVRLLKNGDRCGTTQYVSHDSNYGFCADVPLSVVTQNETLTVALIVDSAGHVTVTPAFDPAPLMAKLNGLLKTALASLPAKSVTPTIESLTFNDLQLQLSLHGGGDPHCAANVQISLSKPSLDVDAIIKQNPQLFVCAAQAELSNALHGFSLLGLDFSNIGNNRVCLSSDPKICIVGPVVSPDGHHIDFSHARLDDGGRLSNLLAQKISGLLPGALVSVSSIGIGGGQLLLTTLWQIPGLPKPVTVSVPIGGDTTLSTDVAPIAFNALQQALTGVRAKWGSLELMIDNASVASNSLSVHGTVTFNSIPVPLTVQVLPSLVVQQPKLQNIASTIANALAALALGQDSEAKLLIGPDFQLSLRVPVIATVFIGGFGGLRVGAVVEATPNSPFRFAGPVTISVPIWIPTGVELDIGNLQAVVDLKGSDTFSLGASVALTPGAELYNILSFDGTFAVTPGNGTVSLNGRLGVLHVPVSTVTGTWLTQEGVLRLDTTSVVGNLLPIPETHVILDGPGCSISGTASAKLVGIELLQANAVVLFPCKGSRAPLAETAALINSCGPAGSLGKVCVSGTASLGDIARASAKFDSHLLLPTPHISAKINVLDISDVSVDASLASAKFEARLLCIDLSVYLPSLEHVNAGTVKDLFLSLLKPSIDLQALLSGKIVISPASGGGKGGDGPSSGEPGGGQPGGAGESENAGNGAGSSQVSSPIITSAQGSAIVDIEPVKGWSGAVQLVVKTDSYSRPYYWNGTVVLRATEEGQQFKDHHLFPIPNGQRGMLSNGRPFILACDQNPCSDGSISLVPLLRSPGETSFKEDRRHLANLAGGAGISFINGGLLTAPELANYLAARAYDGKNMPTMQCLPQPSPGCSSVLLYDNSANKPWAVYTFGRVLQSQDGSVVDLLTRRCNAGSCPPAVLQAIRETMPGVFGWFEQPDHSLSLLIARYEGNFKVVHRRYDKDLAVVCDNEISVRFEESGSPTSPTQSPSSRVHGWSDLAAKLQGLPVDKDQTWILRKSARSSGELFALMGTKPNEADRPIVSALGKYGGPLCIRTTTYRALLLHLHNDWADGKAGPFGGGIDSKALTGLDGSTDGSLLLEALANPRISDKEYRLSPILWMGNPGNPAECH